MSIDTIIFIVNIFLKILPTEVFKINMFYLILLRLMLFIWSIQAGHSGCQETWLPTWLITHHSSLLLKSHDLFRPQP